MYFLNCGFILFFCSHISRDDDDEDDDEIAYFAIR